MPSEQRLLSGIFLFRLHFLSLFCGLQVRAGDWLRSLCVQVMDPHHVQGIISESSSLTLDKIVLQYSMCI